VELPQHRSCVTSSHCLFGHGRFRSWPIVIRARAPEEKHWTSWRAGVSCRSSSTYRIGRNWIFNPLGKEQLESQSWALLLRGVESIAASATSALDHARAKELLCGSRATTRIRRCQAAAAPIPASGCRIRSHCRSWSGRCLPGDHIRVTGTARAISHVCFAQRVKPQTAAARPKRPPRKNWSVFT